MMRASARLVSSTSSRRSSASAAPVSSNIRRVSTRMKRSSNSLRSCAAAARCALSGGGAGLRRVALPHVLPLRRGAPAGAGVLRQRLPKRPAPRECVSRGEACAHRARAAGASHSPFTGTAQPRSAAST